MPTPLFPRSKPNFLDMSETSSISSGTAISRSNSLSLVPDINSPDFLTRSSEKTATRQSFLDVPVIKLNETHSNPGELEERPFSEDLYDRVEEYLDQEGLYISTPSPFPRPRRAKPSMTVVLSTSFLSRSEVSPGTTVDSDSSPYSDFSAPSFLVRRTISGGFKPGGSLSLLVSQMRSEANLDAVQTPFTVNCATRLKSKVLDIHNEETNEIDSAE